MTSLNLDPPISLKTTSVERQYAAVAEGQPEDDLYPIPITVATHMAASGRYTVVTRQVITVTEEWQKL